MQRLQSSQPRVSQKDLKLKILLCKDRSGGQLAYEKEDLLYIYKWLVSVPPISMIEDILCIQKGSQSRKINAAVNTFIELKKLTLSIKKCNRIHIGRQSNTCPDLKIHAAKMNNSTQEKYLGDLINTTGNIKATVADRVARGYGIMSEIRAIISEVPLELEIVLQFRQAMF